MSVGREKILERISALRQVLLDDHNRGILVKRLPTHVYTVTGILTDLASEAVETTTSIVYGLEDNGPKHAWDIEPDFPSTARKSYHSSPGKHRDETKVDSISRNPRPVGEHVKTADEITPNPTYKKTARLTGSSEEDTRYKMTPKEYFARNVGMGVSAPAPVENDGFMNRVLDLVSRISYKDEDDWELRVAYDLKGDPVGRVYLQVVHYRPDAVTGVMGIGHGGKRYLSPHMVDGEIVRIAFNSFLAYEEHEVREFFKYQGRAVFGPHIDVNYLWRVADKLEVRS